MIVELAAKLQISHSALIYTTLYNLEELIHRFKKQLPQVLINKESSREQCLDNMPC